MRASPTKPLRELACTRLDSLNQCATGEVVWLQATATHKAKEPPGFLHLIAPHEDINERIVGDVGRPQPLLLHGLKKLLGLRDHTLLSTSLDECVERDLVHMEKVACGVLG